MTVPFIRNIHINNLLSFGPESPGLELRPLNVLIGPNGSGKTNLIEALGLLQSTSKDLSEPIRQGGGVAEWLWKGGSGIPGHTVGTSGTKPSPMASIEALVEPLQGLMLLRYRLTVAQSGYNMEIMEERIENELPDPERHTGTPPNAYAQMKPKPRSYYVNASGSAFIRAKDGTRELKREDVNPNQSILSQRKDPEQYPEITHLGLKFGEIIVYRDWEFGPTSAVRQPRVPDQQPDHLERDASNLAMMINRMKADPPVRVQLLRYLKEFYLDADDVHAVVRESQIGLRLEERGITTPAARLSGGTLRWLSLLAVLLNPTPPPVVCIEEPELGLHPDIIPTLAKLLLEASQRMQLIVTTHSELLVEELGETPESIVVCEKDGGSTTMRRLEKEELAKWLGKYSLGKLWRKVR